MILKELSVNIPLVKDLEEMIDYEKFMKYIVIEKSIPSFEPADIAHYCSAIAFNSLVKNKKDPGAFIISCHYRVFKFFMSWL